MYISAPFDPRAVKMASPLRFHPGQTRLFRSPSSWRQSKRVRVAAAGAGAGVRHEVATTKPIVGLRELQASLAFAIRTEDFAAAARLRDAIQALDHSRKKAVQVAAVKHQLQEAAAAEDYQVGVLWKVVRELGLGLQATGAKVRCFLHRGIQLAGVRAQEATAVGGLGEN